MRLPLLALATLFASSLAASASPLNVTLVNAGNPTDIAPSVTINGETQNNVYIGPYTIAVNGTNLAAMCVDFNINSVLGSSYTANATAIGSSNLSNTYAPANSQEYKEEAYLFGLITQSGISNADRTAIQEAAWDIMSYSITSSSYLSSFTNTNTNTSSVEGYINGALGNYNSFSDTGYTLISDTVKGGEQEFVVYDPSLTPSSVTPEPSSIALLATGLFGIAGVVRKRLA